MILPPGKLPQPLLKKLLDRYARTGPGVIVGPGIGMDAAVLDAGAPAEYLIAKTDPITFTASDIGSYAITINANDIACMGGVPRWFSACVILPQGRATEALVRSIFKSLSDTCRALNISLVGGHTEITHGLDRPIVVGHMLGTVKKGSVVTASGARPGDAVILTKGIAIEAVSVVSREKGPEIEKAFGRRFLNRCKKFVTDPGISVLGDAAVALEAGKVHSMHDPTEGGLATGLYEIAQAAGVGMEIESDKIRVLPEAEKLLGHFGLDPMGAIASGALLITAPPPDAYRIVEALEASGIHAAVIGRVTDKAGKVRLLKAGRSAALPRFKADELTKLF
jgi:hydrogenase expression/formation protein HypE